MTSSEVAKMLRVSEATLSRWRNAGTGPAWADLNGIARYGADDVVAFVQRSTHVNH